MDHDTINRLLKRETISKLRGYNKKTYQVLLCGIFLNICTGNNDHKLQHIYFIRCDDLLRGDFKADQDDYDFTLDNLQDDLKEKGFKRAKDLNTINKLITFFRTRINDYLVKNKTLFLASELAEILDLDRYFNPNPQTEKITVLPHHWIEFNFEKGLIPTFPEMFTYQDLITLWNKYIDTYEYGSHKPYESQQRDYELASLYRSLTVSAVTFVESYLYYLFYNLRYDKEIKKMDEVKALIRKDRLEDTQIFEGIICKVYPVFKEDNVLWTKYQKYLKINQLRNKYVHASAFEDRADRSISSLQPLLFWNHTQLVYNLNDCINFVLSLEAKLSDSHRILYWWGMLSEPEFNIINPKKVWLLNKEKLSDLV
ncbi:hypothetical protein ACFW0L_25165 [Priestia megaterium]|uniref:hypothetical protein n=1 Tax=Priestia megaterium TaxID=1404 RepID=UPI00367323CD